jgi:3-hydroxyisobutyrate dehydrogenase-like beta-hydroxyacid dehydrogenase
MGAALARVLLGAGHAVTVWNRSPAKAEPLAARGAHVAATAVEAVAASPVTIACVARYEHVCAALGDVEPQGLGGHTLVNLTWGTPDDAQAMERWVQARGGTYLDGGIPVLPSGIGRPETELVYSGPAEVWDRHAAILRALGGTSRHVGEGIGQANVVSLSIPGVFYNVAYGAFFEAAAYAAAEGVAPVALRSLALSAIRLLEEAVEDAIRAIAADEYQDDQATLWIQLDSMLIARDAMQRRGQQGTIVRGLVDVLERGMEAGHGDAACAVIFPMLRDGG